MSQTQDFKKLKEKYQHGQETKEAKVDIDKTKCAEEQKSSAKSEILFSMYAIRLYIQEIIILSVFSMAKLA